jgi:hypothetical protein
MITHAAAPPSQQTKTNVQPSTNDAKQTGRETKAGIPNPFTLSSWLPGKDAFVSMRFVPVQ